MSEQEFRERLAVAEAFMADWPEWKKHCVEIYERSSNSQPREPIPPAPASGRDNQKEN